MMKNGIVKALALIAVIGVAACNRAEEAPMSEAPATEAVAPAPEFEAEPALEPTEDTVIAPAEEPVADEAVEEPAGV